MVLSSACLDNAARQQRKLCLIRKVCEYHQSFRARFCCKQDKFKEADPLYIRAIEIQKKVLGPDHPSIFFTLKSRATALESQVGESTKTSWMFSTMSFISVPDAVSVTENPYHFWCTTERVQAKHSRAVGLFCYQKGSRSPSMPVSIVTPVSSRVGRA